MRREICLKEKKIKYYFKKCHFSRSLRLLIYPDGRLLVTGPPFLGTRKIEIFLQEKADWILEKIDQLERGGETTLRNEKSNKEYLEKKELARKIILQKTENWAARIKLSYGKISIRNQCSRWGSCSRKGNLNFNYQIAFFPEELLDYVVVHELCHLKEFNHSLNFWRLVENFLPNYQLLRRRIKILAKSGSNIF